MLEYRLLGPFEVRVSDRAVPLRRHKLRSLLAVLLLRRGEALSVDRLLDDLWGERPPRTARQALQNYVSLTRPALGVDAIHTSPSGYALQVEPEQIDLGRFELLTAAARAASDEAERAETLRRALALWRGPPLADFTFEPFAQLEAPHLEDLRLSAYQDLIDAELALGRHANLVSEIESLVDGSPSTSG